MDEKTEEEVEDNIELVLEVMDEYPEFLDMFMVKLRASKLVNALPEKESPEYGNVIKQLLASLGVPLSMADPDKLTEFIAGEGR